jgi:hypothetical protein
MNRVSQAIKVSVKHLCAMIYVAGVANLWLGWIALH